MDLFIYFEEDESFIITEEKLKFLKERAKEDNATQEKNLLEIDMDQAVDTSELIYDVLDINRVDNNELQMFVHDIICPLDFFVNFKYLTEGECVRIDTLIAAMILVEFHLQNAGISEKVITEYEQYTIKCIARIYDKETDFIVNIINARKEFFVDILRNNFLSFFNELKLLLENEVYSHRFEEFSNTSPVNLGGNLSLDNEISKELETYISFINYTVKEGIDDIKEVKIIDSVICETDAEKIFCRKCGKQIPQDSIFCMYCGTDVLRV